jgi:16S rRNA G1207 methylase RsmC
LLSLISYLLFALAAFIGYFFLSGFIWGAGYYPTSKKEIDSVARLLELHDGSRFYDLGSGYGRMIITMSEKFGAQSTGVEIDPIKCWWTRHAIRRKGLEKKTRVIRSNFLAVNIEEAEAIFVFLTKETKIMEQVYSKIRQECRPGTKVVSFEHQFKEWSAAKREGRLFLYLLSDKMKIHDSADVSKLF